MKTIAKHIPSYLLTITLALAFSCYYSAHSQTETDLKQWTEAYAKAISSHDWADKMAAFGWEGDYTDHKKFRDAYADYNASIYQIVVEGNFVMAWMVITAKYVGNFPHDVLKDTEPTGQAVYWPEIWHFNVVEGKLGDTWNMFGNGVDKMKSAGVKCLPED